LNKKYFIAILLPQRVLEQVEAFKLELLQQFNLKGALRSPAHITLHRPFEWKEEKEEQLIDTLSEFKFEAGFDIVLKDFNCFEPRVIFVDVMRNESLNELHTQLKYFAQEKLRLFNEVEDMRGFHPHVTVAFRDLKKNRFAEIWGHFVQRQYNASFAYEGITLLKLEKKWEPYQHFSKM
jgi:2'-5' RNA ligase